MLLPVTVMGSIWIFAWAIKKFLIKNCSIFLAGLLAFVLATAGAFIQVFVATSINEQSGLQIDPTIYVSGAFLTLFISIYVVYSTLRGTST
jgi:hypothetical protein